MSRKRYVPDLSGMMAECEANYLRLSKLLPDISESEIREFALDQSGVDIKVTIRVVERFIHTLTVELTIGQILHPELPPTRMTLRMYQDARMVEVVDAREGRQIKGVHTYPNEAMHHPDEKHQLNLYLGQWLRQCLTRGYEPHIELALDG